MSPIVLLWSILQHTDEFKSCKIYVVQIPTAREKFRRTHRHVIKQIIDNDVNSLLWSLRGVLVGIVPHGASLGVIVRRARVQVSQVLGCVLSNPQVSHCDSLLAVHLCTGHIHLVHVLVFILVLIQIVTLQTSYYHYYVVSFIKLVVLF